MTDPSRPRFAPIADPPAAVLDAARVRFETGEADLARMAQDFGMALSTLKHRIRHRWKWSLRRAAPKALRKGRTTRRRVAAGRGVRARLDGSVRGMLARELTRLEGEFAALPEDGDVERTTRVLTNLVRVLVAMARMDAQPQRSTKQRGTDGHEDTPVDLARLRNDLARRLGVPDADADAPEPAGEPDAA